VAQDVEGYIALAIAWANRLDELALIRANMREQVRRSPLCDASGFAHDFTNTIHEAWSRRADSRAGR
jgi:protein O-GlcNAc transferase